VRRPRGHRRGRAGVPQWARGVTRGRGRRKRNAPVRLTACARAGRRLRWSAGCGERVAGGGHTQRKKEQSNECGASREVATRGEERTRRTAECARGRTSPGRRGQLSATCTRAGAVSSGARQRTSLPGSTDGTSVRTRERTDLCGRARAPQAVPGVHRGPYRWAGVRGDRLAGGSASLPLPAAPGRGRQH